MPVAERGGLGVEVDADANAGRIGFVDVMGLCMSMIMRQDSLSLSGVFGVLILA